MVVSNGSRSMQMLPYTTRQFDIKKWVLVVQVRWRFFLLFLAFLCSLKKLSGKAIQSQAILHFIQCATNPSAWKLQHEKYSKLKKTRRKMHLKGNAALCFKTHPKRAKTNIKLLTSKRIENIFYCLLFWSLSVSIITVFENL